MANIASVAYAIEGPQETLEKIKKAIVDAMNSTDHYYEEYVACINLGYSPIGLDECSLGGEITEEPDLNDGVLRFWTEERWGLQDFHKLLKKLFPDIKVYWIVEEPGCEVYCTNDREGYYFRERYCVDTCIDGNYQSDYFTAEENVYRWLNEISKGRVKNLQDTVEFNENAEDAEDFISIHEFTVMEEE